METIRVIFKGKERLLAVSGKESLLSVLRENGYEISANCGGNGTCNKCKVYLLDGDKVTAVSSCKTLATPGLTVIVPELSGEGLITDRVEMPAEGQTGTGLALDIGTTTLAFYFVDLSTGETLDTHSCLNPQGAFGADVISRVEYATKNGVTKLHETLKERINVVISDFTARTGKAVDKMTVTGNTVMLHIFLGEEIASFGKYPFTPVFLEKRAFGKELGYQAARVITLPCFSSFVGADITCGAIATKIEEGTNLLVDLGTNGEMLLSYQGKLYATSVAAGPAFEGAGITCGMGGVPGAISKITQTESGFSLTTVGGEKPKGICGSGLLDGVSYLLKTGVIDETGAFQTEEDIFYFTPEVYLTGGDIRAFQLAKSAVRAGIETLLSLSNATEIDRLYIAGGLGYYIDKNSAAAVGLIPPNLKDKTVAAGNTAGLGAKACLLNSHAEAHAEALSVSAEIVDLSTRADFTELFMEYMFF